MALHINPDEYQEIVSEFTHNLKAPGSAFHSQRTMPLVAVTVLSMHLALEK